MASDGSWVTVPFLADSAADRTVFSAEVFRTLKLGSGGPGDLLRGVGGTVLSVHITARIRLLRETGGAVFFPGEYVAFTDAAALDMSVLGRDITNLFALIIDRPSDTVCLLGPGHRYVIVEA